MSTDRIERQIVIRAPRTRVWRALTRPEEFSAWFGARLHPTTFADGTTVRGPITIKGYDHLTLEFVVDRMEPEHYFSYRWHPYAVEPGTDYSQEPTTLVEFHLVDVPDGTRLTVTESGFDRLPLERRATAYKMNDGGWAGQLNNIVKYMSERHAVEHSR